MLRPCGAGTRDAAAGWRALDTRRRLGILSHPVLLLLHCVWTLRDSASAYDSPDIALAQALDRGLLTADARLGMTPGRQSSVTVVPR